ncbi:MAG: DinB family protein [Chloroflexota bacterium]
MNTELEQLVVIPLPGSDPEIGRALWAMQDTRRGTLEALQDLPAGALDALTPGTTNTIGTILYHIALVEASWLYEDTLQQPIPADLEPLFPVDSRDEEKLLSKMQGFDLDSYLQRLAVVRGRLLDVFRAMSIEDFRTIRHITGQYDVTPEWILHHLTQHEDEHRGHIQMLVDGLKLQAT